MAKSKHIHMAVIFKASNLNYGEGVGNILTLKKLTTDAKNYSYVSRQAIRYDIVRMLNEVYNYPLTEVDKESGVIQFSKSSTIDKFPEIDFFGYMKTEKKKKSKTKNEIEEPETNDEDVKEKTKIRKAVVRLTDAVSLETFHNEMEFGTNKGLADRIPNNVGNDIFQAEIHRSFYCYSMTFNLDDIGKDTIDKVNLSPARKAERVNNLLSVIKLLYRDIRGKRENLAPVFVIGGIYDVGNPFFYNRLRLTFLRDKVEIDEKAINSVLAITTLNNHTVKEQTMLGVIDGIFSNVGSITVDNQRDVEGFFAQLRQSVDEHYNGNAN
ncbi:type I-B CRISPR-associated protein Cas7/Cst2/DevR [Candidatus Magnetobacterium casense]|uniref:type I-B CRISPR-associated protein Cas7/Cst2/DevR n=1 Tax=Candidatus Magnetobacterium casense TaxID=1455061 RepID=UPI00059013FC|nr:type I-B CRISPR-associated protein Cas7/Cst2/DevR [Candidatus Magnetobacterium casensis]